MVIIETENLTSILFSIHPWRWQDFLPGKKAKNINFHAHMHIQVCQVIGQGNTVVGYRFRQGSYIQTLTNLGHAWNACTAWTGECLNLRTLSENLTHDGIANSSRFLYSTHSCLAS